MYNNTNLYFVYDESRLIVTQHRYFRYPSIYQPSIRGMVMVWLPWQCSSARGVSADWLSSILSPHSGGRRVARGLEREELLLRPRAAGKHADQFGARPGRDIWALGPLPQGAKVSSQSVPFPFIYFTASGTGTRPFPFLSCHSPRVARWRVLESWKWDTYSTLLPSRSKAWRSPAISVIIIHGWQSRFHTTPPKRPHWRARHSVKWELINAAKSKMAVSFLLTHMNRCYNAIIFCAAYSSL